MRGTSTAVPDIRGDLQVRALAVRRRVLRMVRTLGHRRAEAGSLEYLLERHGLTPRDIADPARAGARA